jgi:hypothetical protein
MSLTLNLPPDQEATLNAKARAHGVSAEQYAYGVIEKDLKAFEGAIQHNGRHISEIIAEIMADIPADEIRQAPQGRFART